MCPAVACEGSWSACNSSCSKVYSVSVAASVTGDVPGAACEAEAGEVDKQTFPAIGLKVKKANAASGAWTPAVQAKFVAVVQAEPPSFG